ncbi:helix-turn-helix domain-containing protein [Ulvibacter litoralis]|uniref:Helix-turn-helix domain-containing protein n=1 Tax=Ulvibacter litoralis TaxID=227084 RepID=A0A1G7D2M3_9FLAO|nr:helix-turn-helix domain-containing protein [Ulvibacter litoralis]GHC45054.1 hypothetical protein GCM10008083_04650 [Ulvibacter litoralis]SDE45934.1 Helix-turn-helix domain-containing protein [Ulvibacter litoralis]
MRPFLFVLCLFFAFLSQAQQDPLSAKTYKELTEIINANTAVDTTLSLEASRAYLEKATTEKDAENQWKAYHAFTVVYLQASAYDKATVFGEKLREHTYQNKLEAFYFKTHQTLASVYLQKGVLSKSLDEFNAGLAIAEAHNNIEEIQAAYFGINLIESIGGDYASAIQTQKELIQRVLSSNDTSLSETQKEAILFKAQASIADSYLKAKQADSAYHYSSLILKKSLENKDSCFTKNLYWQLGKAELLLKEFDAAKKSFDYSTQYCRPLSKFDSLIVGGLYAKVYAGKKQYKKTIFHLEEALAAYPVSEAEEGFMDDYYKVLANAYKEEKNLERASFYFEKYVNTTTEFNKIKDTIHSSFRNKELEEFRAELAELKTEKEAQKGYLKYVSLAATIVILGLLFVLLKFYRTKKQNELKFEALIAKLKASEKKKDIIDTKDAVLEEKTTNDIPEETKQQILDGLRKLEEKEYFLKQECNSYNVAKKINTNTSYLSKVINAHYGKNFNTYINDLRINYAIVRLKDDVIFRSYSIQSIAEELGYKSADSFTKYFKKDTGLNPSFYIKEIKNIT